MASIPVQDKHSSLEDLDILCDGHSDDDLQALDISVHCLCTVEAPLDELDIDCTEGTQTQPAKPPKQSELELMQQFNNEWVAPNIGCFLGDVGVARTHAGCLFATHIEDRFLDSASRQSGWTRRRRLERCNCIDLDSFQS